MIKRLPNYFLLVLFFIPMMTNSQSDLAFYNDVMSNAYEATHRVKASSVFDSLFSNSLNKEGSFENSYEELKWVSIKYPQDKSFRIITWQVKGNNEVFKYYGYLQKADGTLFALKDKSASMSDPEFEQHDPEYWFGALYYNMIEREVNGEKVYFMFGYNGLGPDIQLKVIDELHFDEGKPLFGNESFIESEDNERPTIKNRILVDYSETANVNCNFNEEMDMIVHDFVTPRLGVSPSGRPVKIPDGTYVGYEWKDNNWNRIDRIKNQISTPESIYYQPKEKDNKDIFGRPKNK